jgi:hypothetical protein
MLLLVSQMTAMGLEAEMRDWEQTAAAIARFFAVKAQAGA